MAKTLHGYWSGYPCSVGVAAPNVAWLPIIGAEKCTQTNIYMRGMTVEQKIWNGCKLQ